MTSLSLRELRNCEGGYGDAGESDITKLEARLRELALRAGVAHKDELESVLFEVAGSLKKIEQAQEDDIQLAEDETAEAQYDVELIEEVLTERGILYEVQEEVTRLRKEKEAQAKALRDKLNA